MAWMRALCAACCRASTPGTWSACYALMVRINSVEAAAMEGFVKVEQWMCLDAATSQSACPD